MMIQIKALPYKFRDPRLLEEALTHPSLNQRQHNRTYERLEFIGDSVLGLCIAHLVFITYPDAAEGVLSRIQANLVNTSCLAKIADDLGIGQHILMDEGEERAGGRQNPRNLENALEALLGAIFLDSDHNTACNIIWALWRPLLADDAVIYKRDYKSELQEWAQRHYSTLPEYSVVNKEGVPHKPLFTVTVKIPGISSATSDGKSRKEAERQAAKILLDKLEK